jgi:glycosyltransferase involved in cell wall biosynthesis
MKLSIVTINYNNAEGLRRTLDSVAAQTYRDIEHIIIDGGSDDGSTDIIKEYVQRVSSEDRKENSVAWVSEKDNGIYNAMNKGIEIALGRRVVNSFNRSELVEDKHGEADRPEQSGVENKDIEIALGRRIVNTDYTTSSNSLNVNRSTLNESQSDYIQILNSGDILAADDVSERMVNALHSFTRSTLNDKIDVPILYGNMIKKDYTTGKIIGKSKEVDYSLRQYYASTMNHDCCYIRRDVYEKYGLYDENLKIVSDWKWFLQAIGLGNVKPVYVDIDVTIFDMSGISETNLELRNKERRLVLEEVLPPAILADYDKYAFPIEQYNRLKKYHLWPIVYFMERVLFKLNKWGVLR